MSEVEKLAITENNRDTLLLTESEQDEAVKMHLDKLSENGRIELSENTIRWASYDAICYAQHIKTINTIKQAGYLPVEPVQLEVPGG